MKVLDSLLNSLSDNKYYQYAYFIITFLLLLAITIYFYPIHSGHDLNFHLLRFDALIEAIKDGAFPVYLDYQGANEYGYAAKWFYSDFVLLPFAYLAQFCEVLTAYKVMIVSYTILCGYITYISIYKVFNNRYIAFIVCLLYTFSYYRLYDVYNRAALGESICLTFIPLVIWGAYEIIKGDYRKWYIIAIAFTLMIFSHINTPPIVAFVTAIFFIINYKSIIKEPIRLLYLGLAAIVTILASAYFLFPLLEQMASNDFYYALTDERAISFPVYAGEPIKYIIRGLFSGATYVVPEIAGIGIVITFCILLRAFILKDDLIKKGDRFLIIGLLCLFIISPLYPWSTFPFNILGFIQFSWRFYSVATIIFCVAGAIYFYRALPTEKRKYIVGVPFILIMSIVVISNSGQVFTNNRPEFKEYSRAESSAYGLMGAEYMPQKLPSVEEFISARGKDSIRSIHNETEIKHFDRKLRQLVLDVDVRNDDELELPLIYYKGYKAEFIPSTYNVKIAENLSVTQSENGLVLIPVTRSGTVKVFFGGTIVQNVSPYITLLMIILLTAYIIWFNRKEKNAK